ncbi:hypothetical protein HWV62_217 [Athelia sp. TMB]|nr:hypothetical protein HWV62_217 [Athelia sp. TMB]
MIPASGTTLHRADNATHFGLGRTPSLCTAEGYSPTPKESASTTGADFFPKYAPDTPVVINAVAGGTCHSSINRTCSDSSFMKRRVRMPHQDSTATIWAPSTIVLRSLLPIHVQFTSGRGPVLEQEIAILKPCDNASLAVGAQRIKATTSPIAL